MERFARTWIEIAIHAAFDQGCIDGKTASTTLETFDVEARRIEERARRQLSARDDAKAAWARDYLRYDPVFRDDE